MKLITSRSLLLVTAVFALVMLLNNDVWSREIVAQGKLFGPKSFEKVRGEIGHFMVHVPCPPGLSSMRVLVTNGEKGKGKLKRAIVSVNGVPIDKPGNFFSKGKSEKILQSGLPPVSLVEVFIPDLKEEGVVIIEVFGEMKVKRN